MALYKDASYVLVNTPEKLDALLEGMRTARVRAIDTETSGLSVLDDYICGISVAWEEGKAYYIPIGHDVGKNLPLEETIEKLRPSFEDPDIVNIAHGKKFDGTMLAALQFDPEWAKKTPDYATDLWLTAFGRELNVPAGPEGFQRTGLQVTFGYDTMVMAYLTGRYANIGTNRSTASLKKIVKAELGIDMVMIEDLFQSADGKRKKVERIKFETLDPDEKIPLQRDIGALKRGTIVRPYEYACADSDMTLRLFNRILPRVKDQLLLRVDMGVLPITKLMELNGVYANVEKMNETYKRLTDEADKVKKLVYRDVSEVVGQTVMFDLGSPTQVGKVLFEMLHYPVIERSEKSGKPLTNAKVLEVMGKDFPLVANILTWRSLRKNAEDFFLGMQDYISKVDGRIHCSYATAHVKSGRYASENPNMQNQPRMTKWKIFDKELPDGMVDSDGKPLVSDEGHKFYEVKSNLRRCYEAIPDFYMLEGDYSQIEYRVFAGRSQARALLNAYRDNADLHTRNASMIFGIPESEVTKALRTEAKTYSFGIMYGMAANGISLRTGRSKAECQMLYNRYFEAIPEGKQHIRDITDAALQNGYVVTHFGRTVHIRELKSDNRSLRFRGEREAFNMTIQGTAADILRIGMTRLTTRLINQFGVRFNDKVKPVLTTHDSLAFMVHRSVHPDVMVKLLQEACEVDIPDFPHIAMEFAVGKNYGELVDWEELRPTFDPNDPDLGVGSETVTLDENIEYMEEHSESISEPSAGGFKHVADVLPVASSLEEFSEPAPAPVHAPATVSYTPYTPTTVVQDPTAEPQHYSLIATEEMTQAKAVELKDLLVRHPGKNVITLVFQNGDELPMTGCPTSLGKKNESMFQVVLRCHLAQTNVSLAVITKGLKL